MSSSSSSRLEPSVLRLRGGSAGVVSLSETHELEAVFARHQALVVVEFTASWCRPCQAIAPQYEALAAEEAYSNVVFVKVDVDDAVDICNDLDVQGTPSFVFFKEGKEVHRFAGAKVDLLTETLRQFM